MRQINTQAYLCLSWITLVVYKSSSCQLMQTLNSSSACNIHIDHTSRSTWSLRQSVSTLCVLWDAAESLSCKWWIRGILTVMKDLVICVPTPRGRPTDSCYWKNISHKHSHGHLYMQPIHCFLLPLLAHSHKPMK